MKKPAIAVAGISVLLAAITFGSPYWALHQMRQAIAERDADALSDHVDFVALRESLKGQVMGGMMESMDSPETKSNPFAGIGRAIGAAMVGPMIDSMVSPAGVIALMKNTPAGNGASSKGEGAASKPDYGLTFKGLNRVTVHRTDTDNPDGTITLRRFGLWDWKLTAIALPAGAFKK